MEKSTQPVNAEIGDEVETHGQRRDRDLKAREVWSIQRITEEYCPGLDLFTVALWPELAITQTDVVDGKLHSFRSLDSVTIMYASTQHVFV